jgi:hypothetical protein
MIGGVIVTDDKTVLVRALGPTLTQFGGRWLILTTIGKPARRKRKFRRPGLPRLMQPSQLSMFPSPREIILQLSVESGRHPPEPP